MTVKERVRKHFEELFGTDERGLAFYVRCLEKMSDAKAAEVLADLEKSFDHAQDGLAAAREILRRDFGCPTERKPHS